MHTLPEFTTVESCPSNRERMNAWYRKVLPLLTKGPNTWSRLRVRGDAIKRQWRAYWKQRDMLKFNNVTHFQSRKTP